MALSKFIENVPIIGDKKREVPELYNIFLMLLDRRWTGEGEVTAMVRAFGPMSEGNRKCCLIACVRYDKRLREQTLSLLQR